jgi:hypothetical protein
VTWLPFDIDRRDAYFAAEDGNLPPPNFIAVNTEEGKRWGHAHIGYLLAKPVHKFSASRRAPVNLASAVQRGLRRRLGADPGYTGLLCKNPTHPQWQVVWLRDQPYTLGELAEHLFPRDMRRDPRRRVRGLGRDCDTFDHTRHWAYGHVLPFRRAGGTEPQWVARCTEVAADYNEANCTPPLTPGEIRKTGKGVGRWTWWHLTEEGLACWRSKRGKFAISKRWAGHVTAEQKAQEAGVSRRTWYRRQAAERAARGTIPISDNSHRGGGRQAAGTLPGSAAVLNWQPAHTPSAAGRHSAPRTSRT